LDKICFWIVINLITGKPGGGKGRLSIELIADEIRHGTRAIITNLPVRLLPWVNGKGKPQLGLENYLSFKYGKTFNVHDRVFVLSDDQAMEFYLYRSESGKLVKCEASYRTQIKDGIEEKRVMDYDTGIAVKNGGVLYCIDEAWKIFGSRNWWKTSEGMIFYTAQHRHFGDDVMVVCQQTKQIDTAIVRVAENFWVVTNHGNKVIGWFRRPSVFEVNIYDSAPTGAKQTPMATKYFRLDPEGLAQCYDTSAGVGIVGRTMADIGSRKRGLPVWTIPVALVLMVWLIFKGFHLIAHGIFTPFNKYKKGNQDSQKVVQTNALASIKTNVVTMSAGVPLPIQESVKPSALAETYNSVNDSNQLQVTGYVLEQGNLTKMWLSNGREVNPIDVIQIRVGRVILRDGSEIPMRQAGSSVAQAKSETPLPEIGRVNEYALPKGDEPTYNRDQEAIVYHMKDSSKQAYDHVNGVKKAAPQYVTPPR
jgi:hypothetical protein